MTAMSRLTSLPAMTVRSVGRTVAVAAGLLLAWTVGRMWYQRRHLPPGPSPLPLLGNLLSIGATKGKFLAYMKGLRQKYGEVVTLFFGPVPFVLLNGYDAIYEVFIKNGDKCHVRHSFSMLLPFAGETQGLMLSAFWKEQRKISLEALREHGMGKISLDDKIHEELTYLFNVLDSSNGETCTIHDATRSAIANIICNITFGTRFEYSDETYTSLIGNIVRLMTILPEADLSVLYPVVACLSGKWKEVESLKRPILTQIDQLIEGRVQALDVANPNSYVDSMLIAALQKGTDADKCGFSRGDILANVLTLITAGMDTTDSAVRWALLYLISRDDIQDKLYSEIVEKIGAHRLPSVRDRQHMPYTEAFLTEILRTCNPAFLTLPYTVSQSMVIAGRHIPAGSFLIGNLASVGYDDRVFENPDEFKPERHLDTNGNYVKPDTFLPFSLGRRSCMGESLARMELFLFLTSIVQRYKLLPPVGKDGRDVPLSVTAQDDNMLYVPCLYKCKLFKRF